MKRLYDLLHETKPQIGCVVETEPDATQHRLILLIQTLGEKFDWVYWKQNADYARKDICHNNNSTVFEQVIPKIGIEKVIDALEENCTKKIDTVNEVIELVEKLQNDDELNEAQKFDEFVQILLAHRSDIPYHSFRQYVDGHGGFNVFSINIQFEEHGELKWGSYSFQRDKEDAVHANGDEVIKAFGGMSFFYHELFRRYMEERTRLQVTRSRIQCLRDNYRSEGLIVQYKIKDSFIYNNVKIHYAKGGKKEKVIALKDVRKLFGFKPTITSLMRKCGLWRYTTEDIKFYNHRSCICVTETQLINIMNTLGWEDKEFVEKIKSL